MVDRGGIDPLLFGQGPSDSGLRSLVNELLTAVAMLTVKMQIVETSIEELGSLGSQADYLEGESAEMRCGIEQLRSKVEELDRRTKRA
jgi:hypothetical protein